MRNIFIDSHQFKAFRLGLCNQHPIERVFVYFRKASSLFCMKQTYRQHFKILFLKHIKKLFR
ncbi:hypothetical protein NM2001072_2105 [Neisseria meningitidis 2001072]|nr:hypothetical protein NM2001072_2105 [Neisseria meningitidis 2001072]